MLVCEGVEELEGIEGSLWRKLGGEESFEGVGEGNKELCWEK